MITWQNLTDATNYEFRAGGDSEYDTYTWIEGMDCELGVEVRIKPGGSTVQVINTELEAGIELPVADLLRYGRIAIDYVQFYEYAREADYSFRDVGDALLAMGCGYGFTGSDMGLGIALDYGFWIDIALGNYRIWGENGMDYYAATPAGCATAWQRAMRENDVIAWAAARRKVNA